MLRPTQEELEALEKEYKEENRWLPEDNPLDYILRHHVNDYAYNVLKDKLPEELINVLKGGNVYKGDDTYAIGSLSHLLAGYIQITEDRIQELENTVTKLTNQLNIRK